MRVDGRESSQATAVAIGISSDGERHVLGPRCRPVGGSRVLDSASSQLGSSVGSAVCVLIVADAHDGLTQTIATVPSGATRQRCHVHLMRNVPATVPQSAREAVAAIVRTISAQQHHGSALAQLKKVAEGLRSRCAKAAALLEDAAEDILAYRHVPVETNDSSTVRILWSA